MSRYRLATRAYPTDYWEAHGDEILDVANELNISRWSFRESRHLFAHGLRTRSLAATGGSPEQMWIQAISVGLLLAIARHVTVAVAARLELTNIELAGSSILSEVLGVCVLIALTISTRFPTMLLACGYLLVAILQDDWALPRTEAWVALTVFVLLAAAVAWRGTGRRAIGTRWMVALAMVMMAGLTLDLVLAGLVSVGLLAIGLLLAPLDPRMLAIAAVHAAPGVIVSLVVWINPPRGLNSAGSDANAILAVTSAGVWVAVIIATTLANRRLHSSQLG